jgi:hypothetical protein
VRERERDRERERKSERERERVCVCERVRGQISKREREVQETFNSVNLNCQQQFSKNNVYK